MPLLKMFRSVHRFSIVYIIFISLALGNCGPRRPATNTSQPNPLVSTTETAAPQTAPVTQTALPPSQIDFNNPLTGLPVADLSLLQLPPVLVSISHFPVEARPQAGLSFAPYVFEIYITEGATRFLTTFYGEFPAPEAPITGNCEIRREIFAQTAIILGSQVWHDENQNGSREVWERGIGGVCVNLSDAGGTLLQQTTSDSNGYYGFNVHPGTYMLEFLKPP